MEAYRANSHATADFSGHRRRSRLVGILDRGLMRGNHLRINLCDPNLGIRRN